MKSNIVLMAATLGNCISAFGLTTAEVVAVVKPAGVTITQVDASGKPIGGATGWFYSSNMIVTNYHVLQGAYSGLRVNGMVTNRSFTVDHINMVDAQTDTAVFTVQENSTAFLNLSSKQPVEGQDIVVIGNPDGVTGTVTTGIVSAIRPEWMQVSAAISPGSSGSPVVNTDGEVIGMIKGFRTGEDVHDINWAVPLSSLKFAVNWGSERNIGGPLSQADPVPLPLVNSAIRKPTRFGESFKIGNEPLTQVLADDPAFKSIAIPFVQYLLDSCDNSTIWRLSSWFMPELEIYFKENNVTREHILVEEYAYATRCPDRSNKIDYPNIRVARMDSMKDTYLVGIPFHWNVSNGKKRQSGDNTIMAAICIAYSVQNPVYVIDSIWQAK